MRETIASALERGAMEAHPSFFEVITATALQSFRDHEVRAALLEVGLGGRLDATNMIAEMYAAHKSGKDKVGIDVINAGTGDCGVLDLLHTKKEAIKLATDAAVTVLRVDQIIMSKPAGGPKVPEDGGGGDD